MPPDRRDDHLALDQFWDDVVLGQPLRSEGVDPVDAMAIGRLHEAALPAIDPGFRRRLRRDLVRADVPVTARVPEHPGHTSGQRGQTLPWVASAAAVLIVTAIVALGLLLRWGRAPEQVIVVPAVEVPVAEPATPSATPEVTSAEVAKPLWRFTDARDPKMGLAPGVAIAPDGNIWITDGVESGFQIFTSDGQLVDRWGRAGNGDGEFNFAATDQNALGAVAFRSDGGFYVADSGNARVQQFTADREFVRAWGAFGQGDGQFSQPIDIHVDAQGNVYVADAVRNDVQKFDADGAYLLTFGGFGSGPGLFNGIGWGDFDAQGNLWLPDAGNNRIQQFSPDGAFLREIGSPAAGTPATGPGLDAPQGVAVGSAGLLFIGDAGNARGVVLDQDGGLVGTFGEGVLQYPVALASSQDDELFVLDYGRRAALQGFRVSLPEVAPP